MTFGSLCVHLMILFQRGKKFQCYLIKNDKLVKILHTARNLTGPGLFVIKKSHVLLVDTIIQYYLKKKLHVWRRHLLLNLQWQIFDKKFLFFRCFVIYFLRCVKFVDFIFDRFDVMWCDTYVTKSIRKCKKKISENKSIFLDKEKTN